VGDVMAGFPRVADVYAADGKTDLDGPPSGGPSGSKGDTSPGNSGNEGNTETVGKKPRTYAAEPVSEGGNGKETRFPPPSDEQDERVHGLFTEDVNSQNGAAREDPSVVHVEGRDKGEYVYVGRFEKYGGPHYFANPFRIGKDGTRKSVLAKYVGYLSKLLATDGGQAELEALRAEVDAGRSLGCHCPGKDGTPEALTAKDELFCHGQLLLAAMAPRGEDPSFLNDEEEL
jgi:hypothetical protein